MTTFQTNVFIGKHGALTSIKNLSISILFPYYQKRELVLFIFEGIDAKEL